MDNKKEILLESTLLNFNILAAVNVIPALLTPGINASIWNKPMNIIDFTFRFVDIFFSIFCWSEKNRIIPKNNVVNAITLIFLRRWISSVECIIYPKIISGIEPIIISCKSL